MALVLADRVKETSTTTGTGTYTLAGAVSGFETFGSIGNGNTTYYACTLGADFEVGIGTYTSSGTTLARTTILQSSNSDNAVDWGAGTKTLFCTQPAEKAVFLNASDDLELNNKNITLGDSTSGNSFANRIKLGASGDLKLFHDGNNSFVGENGNGGLYITGSSHITLQSSDFGETYATFNDDGAVSLRHDNSVKFSTSSTGASITGDLTLTSTDAGATENPTLDLYRNSASPAANDVIGHIDFSGEDSAGNKDVYAKINVDIIDPTSGSEDARLDLGVVSNGTVANRIVMTGNGSTQIQNASLLLAQSVDLIFEGSTNDGNETTLTVTDPTADRTITLPDATGTVLLTDGNGSSLTNVNATTLDSVDSTSFLRSDAADTKTSGDLTFSDDVKAVFGTDGDAELYFDNTNSDLILNMSTDSDFMVMHGTEKQIVANNDSTVQLYHNNSINLETSSTGTIFYHGIYLVSGKVIQFEGASSNANETTLTVTNPTSDNTITLPDATGTVLTTGNSDSPTTTTSSSDADFVLIDDGGTMKKITPANLGVGGGGSGMPTSGGTFTGDVKFNDNVKALFGTSSDFQVFHNASHSFIDNYVGDIYIRNGATDRDVIIQTDDGSGNLSTYFQADGSTGSANLFHYGSIKLYTGSDGVDVVGDLTLTSTDAGDTENPTLDLYRNSSSPADSDVLGHINFSGENDADEKIVYAQINADIADASDGTEDGRLDINVTTTGNSSSNRITMQGNGRTRFSNKDVELNGVDLIFEGATDNGAETTLTVIDPTSDNTITLPDQTGTSMVAVFYDSYVSANQTLSSSYSTIDFDTNRQNSDTAVFSESAGEVTIAKAGVYLISFQLTIGNTSSSRSEGISRLSRKPSGGSYSEVAGSTAKTYHRNNSQDGAEGSVSLMYSVTAGDVFKVEAKRNSGSGSLFADGNGCRFNIMALKIG